MEAKPMRSFSEFKFVDISLSCATLSTDSSKTSLALMLAIKNPKLLKTDIAIFVVPSLAIGFIFLKYSYFH